MIHLLDVSVLLALGIEEHQFRPRVRKWLRSFATDEVPSLATCSITELGFVRIASQNLFGFTVDGLEKNWQNSKGRKIMILDSSLTTMTLQSCQRG